MHSALLLPSKILMFFIICLASSLLLLLATWVMICVNPSTKSTGAVGDAPLYVLWILVLVLGWLLSSLFGNNGLMLCAPVWCLGCPAGVVPSSGGGVAVGW